MLDLIKGFPYVSDIILFFLLELVRLVQHFAEVSLVDVPEVHEEFFGVFLEE